MSQENAAADNTPTRREASAPHILLALVTVAAVAWLAYRPITGAYFRHDDFCWLDVAQKWDAGTQSLAYGDTGVTLIYNLMYHATYHTWGLNPWPFFACLLACHVLNCWLVMGLVWLLSRRLVVTWASGLFFAVLFSHHEAVTWPAAGLHVFVATFFLGATIFWILYRNGRNWALPASMLFTLLALFTKDSGVAILPLLLAVDWFVFPREKKLPLLWHVVAYGILIIWRFTLPPLSEAIEAGSDNYYPGVHMLGNLIYVVPQMVVPDLRFENYLHFLQKVLPPGGVSAVMAAGHAAIIALSVLALWGLWRGSALVRLGILWCYLSFLPFLPFSYEYARAPRYLYIPSIGLALLVGLLVQAVVARLESGLTARKVAAVAIALAYLAGSFGFARLVCSNRLRDGRLREEIVRHVTSHVPVAEAGQVFWLCGLPRHLEDVQKAIPLYYPEPVSARASCDNPPLKAYLFRFSTASPATLLEFYRVPKSPPFP